MNRIRLIANLAVLLAVLASACAPSAGAATPTPQHLAKPGTPTYLQLIWDCNTGQTLPADYSTSGPIQPGAGCDSWQINRYERPFNADKQDIFFPDLDILSGELGTDGTWFYFRMSIFDKNQKSANLTGTYAIELDLDLDGRGDVLVLAHAPGDDATKDWTVQGVQLWGDKNNDVGNKVPLVPDPPNVGNGYDTLVFDSGKGDDPGLAWVRVHPGKPSILELAFKASAISFDPRFKWMSWTDEGVDNRADSDYHDTFDHPVAGDPNQGQTYFPSQAINEVDNTCAAIWGAPQNDDADLCVKDNSVPQPTLETTPYIYISLTPQNETATPTEPQLTESITPTKPNTLITDSVTPTETASPTSTATATPCLVIGAVPTTCTPTPTSSFTPTNTATYTATPCVNPNSPAPRTTCTPTPTMTATQCYSYGAYLTANIVATCTPTPTPTHTATPTGCPNPISITAPSTTCTPTPTECYAPITAGVVNQISTCTPTVTPTPTDCTVPYAFAVIQCSPTPTATPSPTATLCAQPATPTVIRTQVATATLPFQVPCTPTPTQCVGINFAALAVSNCTPTPSPTVCVAGFIIGYDKAGAPIYAYRECTPTMTPTLCAVTEGGRIVATCTPMPPLAETMMVYPDEDANCRRAPEDQNIVDTLFKGVGYLPLGRTPDNLYLLFRGPLTNQRCWVPAFLLTIPFGPLSAVPSSDLPFILYPTATPTPTKTVAAVPQCKDGIDNDGDGKIDYKPPTALGGGGGGDPQCSNLNDNDESK